MAKTGEIMEKVSSGGPMQEAVGTLSQLLSRIDVKKRFEEILGSRAPAFMSSIISAYNANALLKTADPKTVLSAAMMAATLDLPINQNLGFAHLVPYKNNRDGVTRCQFQIGWKGFVQLAIRTGQYKTMNAVPLYEGQIKVVNHITGEIELDEAGKKSDTVVGYCAYFRLLNGFERYYYMSKEAVEKHGRRYSKSFDTGNWKTNFDAMALKTVVKLLLSKWGILSVQMERALTADQAVILDPGKASEAEVSVDFVDAEKVEEEAGTAQEPGASAR
jgi:recombination protein RecT